MTNPGPLRPFAAWPVAIVVTMQVAVLTALSGRYGFHRDELYFVAAGDRPAWGYVDQPPLVPLLARAATEAFGDTPAGLRVVSTLTGAVTVLVVALIARELGGGRGAQTLTAAATALSTYVLVVTHMVSTSTVDLLLWTVFSWLTLRLLRTGNGRWWLPLGAVAGVGLLTKWVLLLLIAALAIGVLAVGPRAVLRSGWLAAGVAIALVPSVPVIWWQVAHDWPMITVATGISVDDGAENRLMFVPQQLIYLSPVLVPVWAAGWLRLWRDPALRWARSLAIAYPVLAVATIALGGKPYYAVPLLLVLLAAGAEPAIRWLGAGGRRVRTALAAGLAVLGAALSVLIGLPVLPVAALDPVLALNKEAGEQVGWPEFAETVAAAWRQIPVEQQPTAVLLTANYGQAGAIERYGPALGLPRPYSEHMSYADWGPPPATMHGPVLLVGFDGPGIRRFITDCRPVARHDNGLGVDNEEQGTQLALCTRLTTPWAQFWPGLRHYY